ncbi:MAG: hypothetical protein WBQ32_08820 [Ignavibacteriaceae bacterium]
MKTLYISLISFFLIVACSNEENQDLNEMETVKSEPHIAKVVEKIPSTNYLYLQVSENKETFWIAVPAMEIETGETIYFSKYMVMSDFKSENIERTFETILFVEDARKSTTPDEMKKIHSGVTPVEKQNIKIEPLADGKTIQQIYEDRTSLNGEMVMTKGKVVKFNKQIMKRNWIHIQDGTGDENSFDLVVTTNDEVMVGDIITAAGKLAVDKDFGAGYFFSVIIEDAKIEKE